jgi:hypothetical protein
VRIHLDTPGEKGLQSHLPTIKGLFINPSKANCSIYESGRMIYESLVRSKMYALDYLEVDENNRWISGKYNFYAFNYHPTTMGWLDTKSVRRLPGLKVTYVLEALPNDPFVLCPADDFDAYCVLDPTMNVPDRRVYAFSRPLETADRPIAYDEPQVPVIGSFGFATPGKGFELVVDAVNKEFEEAVVRINIPSGTYADDVLRKLHNCNYADYLGNLCRNVARKGIQVLVTKDYMTKPELIEWCRQNTLNCFLYNRNQPGLSATTDQAITSGRPLAISTNETFRHIHPYIQPYPFRSLKESIALSRTEVLCIQQEWTHERFAAKFEEVLRAVEMRSKTEKGSLREEMIELQRKKAPSNVAERVLAALDTIRQSFGLQVKSRYARQAAHQLKENETSEGQRPGILIISHREKQCGIYQYGVNTAEALKKSSRYRFIYVECSNHSELHKAITRSDPVAIIYNYFPATMPWLTSQITRQYTISQLGLMHEVTQEDAERATGDMFDFHLCPDPTLIENNPMTIKTKRLIPPYINTKYLPNIVTIGSFGFGFADKGFERLVETVQREFNQAKIVLHLPFNDIVDKRGKHHAIATAKRCRSLIRKPGIKLVINHKFMTKEELLDFLASNTLNAFFYDTEKDRGISSVIEHALAVQRPVAITKCGMFRHVISTSPSICIEDSSLKKIIDNDIVPLVPFYNEWSEAAFVKEYEQIFDRIFAVAKKREQNNSRG